MPSPRRGIIPARPLRVVHACYVYGGSRDGAALSPCGVGHPATIFRALCCRAPVVAHQEKTTTTLFCSLCALVRCLLRAASSVSVLGQMRARGWRCAFALAALYRCYA